MISISQLANENRIVTMNDESKKLRATIESQCGVALTQFKKGVRLFRGDVKIKKDVYIVDPTVSQRVSSGAANYYNLYMDTSPHWQDFPSRSFSTILGGYGSTLGYIDSKRGVNIVLPIGNPKIAKTAWKDFWTAKTHLSGLNISLFNDAISMALIFFNEPISDKEKDPHAFTAAMNNIFEKVRKNEFKDYDEANPNLPRLVNNLKTVNESGHDLYKYFYKLMTPDSTDTSLVTLSELPAGVDCEMWTSGKCIMVKLLKFYELFPEFKKDIESSLFKK